MIDPQDVFKLKICFNLLLGPRALARNEREAPEAKANCFE